MIQLYVWIGEGVTEGRVDDHEKNDAAHCPEWRFPTVQTLSQEPPAYLSDYERDNNSHEELREDGCEWDR